MPKITFIKGGEQKVVEATKGETILACAENNKIELMNACGGLGICTTCMVEVKSGKENLSSLSEEEKNMGFEENSPHRLGCQAKINGDVIVEYI